MGAEVTNPMIKYSGTDVDIVEHKKELRCTIEHAILRILTITSMIVNVIGKLKTQPQRKEQPTLRSHAYIMLEYIILPS